MSEFVLGELAVARKSELEAHLHQCIECRSLFRALQSQVAPRDWENLRVDAAGVNGELAGSPEGDSLDATSFRSPGTALGRYILLERIGQGSMASVYAAHDPTLGRTVAIKILRADRKVISSEQRFLREARALAVLTHPNVVTVHDAGIVDDTFYLALELVKGQTLRRWLSEKQRSWKDIRRVFADAGRGLVAAHTAGLVHRDFKPENVLVGDDGRVRVTDFGLARSLEHDAEEDSDTASESNESSLTITKTGTLVGTRRIWRPNSMRGNQPTPKRISILSSLRCTKRSLATVLPSPTHCLASNSAARVFVPEISHAFPAGFVEWCSEA